MCFPFVVQACVSQPQWSEASFRLQTALGFIATVVGDCLYHLWKGYMIFHTSISTGNCSLMQGVQGLSHFFGQRPKCQRCPFRLPSRKHVYCSLDRKTSKSCPQLIATEAKLLSCEYFAALEDCTAARGPGARPGWGPGLTTRDPHKIMKSLR